MSNIKDWNHVMSGKNNDWIDFTNMDCLCKYIIINYTTMSGDIEKCKHCIIKERKNKLNKI